MPFTGPAEDRLAIRELLEAYADAVCRHDAADPVEAEHPAFPPAHGRVRR
jgi:hypothetical protein